MRRIAVTIALILVCAYIQASVPNFKFRHFTAGQHLSSNRICDILQDRHGYIWIGTECGLDRFDGVNVVSYRYNKRNASSLGNNYASALCEYNGHLYVGTDNGLYVYSYETDGFRLLRNSLKCSVTKLRRDKDGNLWIATNGEGVYRYNPKMAYLERFPFTGARGVVWDMVVDGENGIWAVTNQGKEYVYKLNKVENRFAPVHLKYDMDKANSAAVAIFRDSRNDLWIGTWGNGLQHVDAYSRKVTTYLHPSKVHGTTHIHSIMEYAPGELFVGSDDGLVYINTATREHRLFTDNGHGDTPSLSNRFVYPMIKDNEGGIWIGTYYGGVDYIAPRISQFEEWPAPDGGGSVSGNVISRFCEDNDGNIWIASDDGGLSRMDARTKEFTHFLPQEGKNSISYHNIHALCCDGDKLWIGTYSGGVNVYDLKSGKFKHYRSEKDNPNTLDDMSTYDIFRDGDNNIWVATMSGINRYHRESDDFGRLRLDAVTIDIAQDKSGLLWFATQGKGLFSYDPKSGGLGSYRMTQRENSLPSDQVNCLYVEKTGDMLVGTMDGLCRYRAASDDFEKIELDIPSSNICGIVEDQNVLWLTTTNGLVKYTPGEGCQVLTMSDGLVCDLFQTNSAMKASDGKIYIGSVNGFNAFYPYEVDINKTVPAVRLSGLEIFNKDVAVGSAALPVDMNSISRLDLAYSDNVIGIKYAALSYCMPSKNQYAYMLDGFDKGWNYVGAQNKATYTNLPPGEYLFRVKATNNDGIWSNKEATVRIVIHPPFYLTTPFFVIYALLAALAIAMLIRFFVRRSEKRHNEQIHIINENKEREMHEAKIKFFTMIAHEIRTPVSLIIAPLEKIIGSAAQMPAAIRDDINIIDRNSHRLLFLVNQLLDFRKVEQEGMNLRCSLCNINEIVTSVCSRFAPAIQQEKARFVVRLPERQVIATVDSEAVTKLISNLLTNALKYTKDMIELECTADEAGHNFVIRCRDNGIGISEEEQKKIFKPFYQAADNKPGTGIGLSLVKSIVEAHNGMIDVFSAPGEGSTFEVTLPMETKDGVVEEAEEQLQKEFEPEDILSEKLTADNTGRLKLLIVDDNKEMLNFLSVSFADRYNVVTALDGVEALALIAKGDVAVIVSDWMMPNMDGAELCRRVRADVSVSHIPFLLLTAKADVNSKIEGMDCGADAYIEKPFSVKYLDACIRNIVDMRNMLRQKFTKNPLLPLSSIAGNSADDSFLKRMNQLIEDNFSNPALSVDFLAEHLYISRSGLFAKIKSLADVTPNELIQVVRLKKSALLLRENRYRISEICYMVGFNNPSYFSKCFQKQFGVKPGEFANRWQNGGE